MKVILNIFGSAGNKSLRFIANIGHFFIFCFNAISWLFRPPWYFKKILLQVVDIGYFSLPVVGLTTFFSGMVLALQTYNGFAEFNSETTVARVVLTSITRELGPVLTGLMVAGRIGAKMAAEIATMRVTEQIDALGTLGTRPMQYLIAPKIIASVICLPFLVFVGNTIGILGGYVIAIFKLEFNPDLYLLATIHNLQWIDLIQGSVKAATFGLIISMVSCYFGFNASKGAEGVGYATTASVVISSVMILTSTYIITALFFG
ncbi:ABC transporter permease [Alphaproteobacteria bacterium]|nr:ABC transporter permease [Alphaproteobacteria bacterium]